MRVLLIEDHKPLVRALKQGLEEEGFAVDVAYDGEEGGYKAQTADYDIIILDIMLPKEDGLSLLQRWRDSGLSIAFSRSICCRFSPSPSPQSGADRPRAY